MAAVAAVVLGGAPAVAAADTVIAQATIFAPNAAPTQVSVTLPQLQQPPCGSTADTSDSAPLVNEATTGPGAIAGWPAPGPTSGAWLLSDVLSCMHISLQPGESVEVLRSNGSTEDPLGADDLAPSSEWYDSQAPTIIDDGDNVDYYRPPTTVDEQNGLDVVEGGPILLWVNQGGPPLDGGIAGPSGGVSAGVPATFTATWAAQIPVGKLTFTWSVSGGTVTAGQESPSASVVFPAGNDGGSNTYTVSLEITDTDGSSGDWTLPVTVGTPAAPTTSGTPNPSSGQSQQPSAATTGPQKSGGKVPGAKPGKSHAPRPGSAKHHVASAPATSVANPKRPAHHVAVRPTAIAPSARVPASNGKASSGANAGTVGSTPAAGPKGAAVRASTRPAVKRRRAPRTHTTTVTRTPPPATSGGPLVRGRLVADVAAMPATSSPLVYRVVAPAAAAPAVRRGARSSILPAVGAALAVILLFLGGVGRELRWRRRGRLLPFRG
jgi:hypothetical protein